MYNINIHFDQSTYFIIYFLFSLKKIHLASKNIKQDTFTSKEGHITTPSTTQQPTPLTTAHLLTAPSVNIKETDTKVIHIKHNR